ncbi:hypothetical protein COK30_17580 [Bacillus cereus]|uniref:hypothetical protein n=1 Tax=Bacillus cereus TaxID=1396 RepID=UPI000BFA5F8D|nr:hypothetical protein [Bacillus cereus]PFR11761.1 hypothetical protein COK30_17580 [Bacillus cereus]
MEFPVTLAKLTEVTTLNETLIKLLAGANLDVRPEKVPWPQGDILQKRWLPANTGDALGINSVLSGTGEEYNYIHVQAIVERARNVVKGPDDQFLDRLERINKVTSNVLFFEHDNSIYAAIYMNLTKSSISKINYIIKDLFVERIWGDVSLLPPDFNIQDNTYYWLLNKFIMDDKVISDNPSMSIRTFTGYSGGAVADNGHTVIGEGERISALLGTLAFIFGDDSFKSLKLHVCVNNNNILFELEHKGNVRIYEFDGEFFAGNLEHERILLTLLLYKTIIPTILTEYSSAVQQSQWNNDSKRTFISSVGQMIIERVSNEITRQENLENQLEGIG